MEEPWAIWEREGRPGGRALSKMTGIPEGTLYRWIPEWLRDDEVLAAWKAEREAADSSSAIM